MLRSYLRDNKNKESLLPQEQTLFVFTAIAWKEFDMMMGI